MNIDTSDKKWSLLEKALMIAASAHHDQVDKQGKPYILHPLRVLAFLGTDAPEEWQIVAVLHDVIEDTAITLEYLSGEGFSNAVLESLRELTRNRKQEYSEYIDGIAADPRSIAFQVKRSDLKDNLDPQRLRLLDGSCEHLRKRYERALSTFKEAEMRASLR